MEKIGVIGIGKLGLCFALNLERVGYEVVGVDVDEEYVNQLNNRTYTSLEPYVDDYLQAASNFRATTKLSNVIEDELIDIMFIMVATPSASDGRYDHYQINRVLDKITNFNKQQHTRHLVVSCTTMPGYCDQAAEQIAPYNYTLTYNPEFIAQGNIIEDQQYPDQVLIGETDEKAGAHVEEIYSNICRNKPAFCHMKPLSAEICKIATNCFLTTKISFANSIGDLAIQAGAEPGKILDAIGSDTRIGKQYMKYGYGFGGPCFPRDNKALGLYGDEQNYELLLSKATDEINRRHLEFQFQRCLENYGEDEVIEFDYVTFKKGTPSLEESQQLALAVKLAQAGRKVRIKEQPVIVEELEKQYPGFFELLSHS
jgi:nucleotide sugar dehydrogenase